MEITKEYLEELIKSCGGKKVTLRETLNITASGLQNLLSKHDLLELSDKEKQEKEEIYDYIYNKNMSIKQVAEETGKTVHQVGGKVFKYALNKPVKVVEEINKDYLQREYIEKGRTSKDIAEDLGVDRSRVTSAIHRFGLSGNKVEEFPKHIIVEMVKELYITKDYTRENTAKELGISFNQLDNFMRTNELTNLKGKNHSRLGELKLTEDYLTEEYLVKRRSAYDIACEHKLTDCEIEYMLERYELYGKKGFIKDFCNENKFSVNDPIFCYYAGLIATDGHIDLNNKRVVLRVCNDGSKETLENIAKYFEFTGEVKQYPQYGKYNTGSIQNDLTITSVKLIEELGKMGITGVDKTFKLKFPERFSSDECAKMYMRGVVDGDGSINGHDHTVVCASKDFIKGIIYFINNRFNTDIELKYALSTKNNTTYPRCYIGANRPKDIMDWLYKDFEKYRFKDKYDKYLYYKKLILY